MDAQEGATYIVKTLNRAGYIAYFAGGWVRDYLMKHPSDDIDIATDATPEAVISLFPQTIPVGIAFGVVIVVIDGHPFEVATFRKDLEYISGRRPEKIEHSSPQEDALRRDFTINGMFYDPITETIYDYVNGQEDLKKGIIRTIGSPHERFKEDRLRMIRAIRFSSRFGFEMDPATQEAIQTHAETLFPAVAMERIWQEFHKMAKYPRFDEAIIEMHRLGLLPVIFPELQNIDLNFIRHRVDAFKRFPKNAPTILYLMELFPTMALEELLEMCQYLKASGHEGQVVEFTTKGRRLLHQEQHDPHLIESPDWAYFYADRFFHLCFDAMTARYPEEQRIEVIERHEKRKELLFPHIQRLAEKKPLVTSTILKDHGIPPGKVMGLLLKEAEKIAINNDLHDPDSILVILKQSPLWPK